MISKDEDLGVITAATCISFDLFLHFFLRTNIIKSAVNSMVNLYTVSITYLTELAQSITAMGLFKIEATTCKYKDKILFFQYMLVPISKQSL